MSFGRWLLLQDADWLGLWNRKAATEPIGSPAIGQSEFTTKSCAEAAGSYTLYFLLQQEYSDQLTHGKGNG